MITVNLTVFRETNGTLHMPGGSLLPVVITCEPVGTYSVKARLETVILKHISSALVEQSGWSAGAFVATKVTDICTNEFSYVGETVEDVKGMQSPCCTGGITGPLPVAQWEFFDDEPTDLDAISFTHSAAHAPEADISFSVAGMGPNKWVVVRYPATESDYTDWYNTAMNYGFIPDSVFEAVETIGSYKYIKSRVAVSMDESQPLKFTH